MFYNTKLVNPAIFLIALFCATIPLNARRCDTLSHASPQSAGMDSSYLVSALDSIVAKAIDMHAFPGCQILVARHGKIVLQKSYGYHTYRNHRPIENDHIFDLASCSKVMGATLALMRLVEQGVLDLDEPISNHFPYFIGSNKEKLTFREALAHNGGLGAINMKELLLDAQGHLREGLFSCRPSEDFPLEVCKGLWACKGMRDTIFRAAAATPLGEKKLRYSCMSFLCYPYIIEKVTGKRFEDYLRKEFYAPLGADRIMLTPAHRYLKDKIVPTEIDTVYRNTLVHGYVHDEKAAVMGGWSGNAGLFANTESIAIILQMLLNEGVYGDTRYFNSKTIQDWTSRQYENGDNYRGLGFDRRRLNDTLPLGQRSTSYYYAPSTSERGYGHSGFTGNMFWVDPEESLIFVFLSNRVYPNRKLGGYFDYNPRARCHEAVYEAIRRYDGSAQNVTQ